MTDALTTDPLISTRETRDLFNENMAVFRANAPQIYARLNQMRQPHTRLHIDDDGSIDIALGGRRLYGEDVVKFTERQVSKYLEAPERRFVESISFGNLEGLEGNFKRTLAAAAAAQGAQLAEKRVDTTSHFAIIFGLGLGLHLEPLTELTGCAELIVVEPNFEHLHHSLYVTDWAALFAQASRDKRTVHFVFETEQDPIASHLRKLIGAANPALLDGVYIYQHYGSSVLTAARLAFHRDFAVHVLGLGYFEDELVMMGNAVTNLKRSEVRILASSQQPRPEPIFICGSGPSIDGDLDVIADQRDRAVVISIGSVLRTLLTHNIRPDIHVETENHPVNAENLQRVASEFDLDGITLLAASTVQPSVTKLFDRVILFFRDRQTPSEVFGNGIERMGSSGPTVANAALVTLLYLGFREFYLFGVDMGSRSTDKYHSAQTYIGLGEASEWAGGSRLPTPANFGGDAVAETILNWSRIAFENVLKLNKDIRCVNCSDGARIAGTVPMLPRVLELANQPIDRRTVLRDLIKKLPVFRVADAERIWYEADLASHANDVFTRIDAALDRALEHDDQPIDWVYELYDIVEGSHATYPAIHIFLYGTTCLLLGTFWWFDGRIVDPAIRLQIRRDALRALRDAYGKMGRRLELLAHDVAEHIAGKRATLDTAFDAHVPSN